LSGSFFYNPHMQVSSRGSHDALPQDVCRNRSICPPYPPPCSVCAPRPRGALHSSIPSWRFPSTRLHDDVTSFHPLSVAALQSEGQHLTLRPGSARQAYSDYSHYDPRRADGMLGVLLQCIHPSYCPRYLPLDQSATIGNLCTYPSRMRPLQTPLEHRTPQNATSGRDEPARCRAHVPQA
jgi:hypothetical protein